MKKIIRLIDLLIKDFILILMSLLIKRNEKEIALGSWHGERYADNSKYLAEYISSHFPEIKIYWVGKNTIFQEVHKSLKNVEFLELNSMSANLKLLKCKYMFFTQMHTYDISKYYVYRNAVLCYLHHGMPIKKWGQDGLNQKVISSNILKAVYYHITGFYKEYDYFVTSSKLHDISNCTSLTMHKCLMKKNLPTGTPRNDMYFNVDSRMISFYKKVYAHQLGFPSGKLVIMYLPTYRRKAESVFSFSTLSESETNKINILLEKYNAVLIEKSHIAEVHKTKTANLGNLIFADSNMNVQEMMLFTNILISDYSGAFLDYILLDRPVIHFAYDYDYYKNVDSGLYYDISDFSAGAVVSTFDELFIEIEKLLKGKDEYKEKRMYVREKYMTYEVGKASEQIVKKIMKI